MDNLEDILKDCDKLIKNCNHLEKELKEMRECTHFLINEYKTNKRWFRDEPGRVTIEDVIKRCFEFGWSSKNNFDYNNKED